MPRAYIFSLGLLVILFFTIQFLRIMPNGNTIGLIVFLKVIP